MEHFDVLCETVLDVNRHGGTRYRAAVEERVCSRCAHQDAQGVCPRREQGRCAVAVYLPLIVEALQPSR